tara:strand:+ start:1402 stop:2538 length:1137 start_codon:yes stop_codon:yes gene_type:complete
VKDIIEIVLFLGTGRIQVPAIKEAKKRGFKIIGIDKNNFSSGKKLCNYFFNISSNNVELIYKKIAKIRNIKVICIWANNDIFLISKSLLEQKLNIKTLSPNLSKIKLLINKSKFKKIISGSRLSIKKLVKNNIEFPLLLKPSLGSGSKGIKFIHNKSQLKKINKKEYVSENYIKSGTEYGINFYRTKDKIFHLPSVKRFFDHKISFSPLGTLIVNSKVKNMNLAYRLLEKLTKKLNLYGQIKYDLILGNYGPKLFELSSRFHGEIDTTHLFKYINSSVAKFYFAFLRNDYQSYTLRKNNINYGYVSIYNHSISKKDILKSFEKFNIHLREIVKRDNYIPKKIISVKSTNDIYCYAFFETKKNIPKSKFINLFKHINRL